MSDNTQEAYRKSTAPFEHRVTAGQLPDAFPCHVCGAAPEYYKIGTETDSPHIYRCPNRNRKAGRKAAETGACRNTGGKYRKSVRSAIATWNWLQRLGQPGDICHGNEKQGEDGPRCACGLLLPCTCADVQSEAKRPARATTSGHNERRAKLERIVFPPMPDDRFAELHARWLARQKRDPNRGAPSPEDQAAFQAHRDRMRAGRARQRVEQYEAMAPRAWMDESR